MTFDAKHTKPSFALRGSAFVFFSLALIVALIHRPLPEGFTAGRDRFIMHFVEPALRLAYLYPTQYLCAGDAQCRLQWTRGALSTLASIFGPWTMWSRHVHINTTTFDGVKVRVYTPKWERSDNGAIFFIHGGGFAIGDVDLYEALTREIAIRSQRVVVSVDYRLAPAVRFPGGLEDCERAFAYFLTRAAQDYGVDPNKVVLMGDSAGGNLVAALTQRRVRRQKEALDLNELEAISPLAQVLLYPLLQVSDLHTPSYLRHHELMGGFALVDPESVALYYIWYAGVDVMEEGRSDWPSMVVANRHTCDRGALADRSAFESLSRPTAQKTLQLDRKEDLSCDKSTIHPEVAAALAPFLSDPDFAPLQQKNLSGLPQALVVTMEFDVLRDEGATYAKRLQEAGVPTTWRHYSQGFHAILNFLHFPQDLALGNRVLDEVLDWTAEKIANA